MKRLFSIWMMFVMLVASTGAVSFAGEMADSLYLEYDGNVYKYNSRLVTVSINGSEVETGDMPAVIIDGSTLVPVREVFESEGFGASVTWNGDKQEIYIAYADKLIVMKIDSLEASVNGEVHELSVAPKLIRDMSKDYAKTMIPLRFVSEVLDFEVDWDADTYTASLSNGQIAVVPETTTAAPVTEVPETSGGMELVAPETTTEKEGPILVAPSEGEDPTSAEEGTTSTEAEETTTKLPDELKPVEPTDIVDKEDPDVVGEKLDGLSGGSASRDLPTDLQDNPVRWSASSDQLEELESTNIESEITDEDHSETQIKRVTYDDTGVYKTFTLEASSAMSSIDYFVWDGKFIMDISNAINKLPAEQPFEDNPILTGVRASQYSLSPNAVRVVFDIIDGGSNFALSFNDDRSKLYIKVMDNSIHDIYLGQNDTGDFIKVTGVASPDVKMFRLSHPDRIVIDFPNTQTVLGFNEAEAEGQYIEKIRSAQFDEMTTRIVVEIDGQPDYEIAKAEGGQTIIQFFEPGYQNIAYENYDSPTIAIDQVEEDIDVEGIRYVNDYMNRQFDIILSKNYGDMFGKGSLKVNDGIIDTIEIDETEDGQTKIVIQSVSVHEYRVEEVDDKIYVKAYKPNELYDRIVVVDPGHGGKDPGAIANGMYEKDLNLTITEYLKDYMDADGSMKVYYTRLDDTYPTLQERCDIANEVEADLFLSIHNNAYNPSEKGTETLYFPTSETDKLTSPGLSQIYQDLMVDMLGTNDRGIKQRENLFVLKHTAMPATIIEIGFMTNSEDAAMLQEEDNLKIAAEALYKGTVEAFETYPTNR